MPIENIEVTQQATNVIVTPPASTSLTVNQAAPINVEVATLGLQGAVGPTPDLDIGTVTTGAAGSSAAATITGTLVNPLLNLTIPRGDTGATGATGPTGPANVLTVGTVTKIAPAFAPTVTVSGTSPNQVLEFDIPGGARILNGTSAPASGTGFQGDWFLNTVTSDLYEKTAVSTWTLRSNIKGATGATGNTGATGPANQLSVDSVTASAPGSTPVVTIGGAAPTQTISFVLPRGDTGPTGPAPNLAIGTVTTVAPGGTATADVTGTNPNYSLNIGIPRGDKGEIGAQWITGNAAPTSGIGVEGDFYLVTGITGLGDVYEKTDTTTWTLQGNIRGAAGNGSVNAVNSVLPDVNGNVLLTWSDFTGVIPASALPSMATTETYTVASEAAMLALAAQRGDLALRTDLDETFILAGDDPAILANWTALLTDGGNVRLTGDQTIGGIKTFSVAPVVPNASWTIASTSGLQAELDLKAPLASPTFTGTVSGITAAMVGLGNVVNLAQVDLINAQTIGGVKTFSDAPVVPVNSWTIANTSGLQTALDGKAASVHTHDAGAVTTGTFAIARIPTGTTGTTVALGNHLHTGVYEPVIAAGTTSQYRRGDNTWRDLGSDAVLLTGAQTIAGTKTFSSIVESVGLNASGPIQAGTVASPLAVTGLTSISTGATAGLNVLNPAAAAAGVGAQIDITGTSSVFKMYQGSARWVGAASTDSYFVNFIRVGNTLTERLRLDGAGVDVTGDLDVTGTITTPGNISAGSFFGGGSNISGVVHTTGNESVAGSKTFTSGAEFTSSVLTAAGLTNASARPAVGTGRIAGEISGRGSTSASDDGFLRLSAGGGTSAVRSYIDISGHSTVTDMNRNIVFGTENVERLRIKSTEITSTIPIRATTFISDTARAITITHAANVADGVVLTNTTLTNGFSPRIFWQNDTGSNVIMRSTTNLIITTGAVPGSSSGTARITIADTGDVTFANSIDVSGNVAIGSGSLTTAQLSNTATNTIAVGTGSGVNVANGLLWRANGAGWVANISNAGTGTPDNGLLVSTTSVAATTGLLQADSGGVNRFKVMADGSATFSGLISTQKPIIDWNGTSTSSQWQKRADNVVTWTSTSGVETGELVFDTELPNTLNVMTMLHVKGLVHATNDGFVDLLIKFYWSAGAINTIQILNNGTFPVDTVRFYLKTATNTLSVSIDSPNADWDWAKVWVDGYFGHSTLVTDAQLDGWTASTNTSPTTSGYTLITSGTPIEAVHTDNAQTITGTKTFSSLITGTAGVSTGGVLTVPGTSYQTFGASGASAPTFTTRSAGTKIVLYEGLTASAVDYAIGIESSTLWQSVPSNAAGSLFKWYGGTTNVMTLTGTGSLTVNGGIVGSNLTLNVGNGQIELGRTDGVASVPYIDFHAGTTATDFDARIQTTSGNGTNGGGAMTITATAGLTVNGPIVTSSQTVTANSFFERSAVATGTSGTVTLNASTAAYFTLTPTGNVTTLSITNVPASGNVCTISLYVSQGATAYTIATPSGGIFVGAASPTQVANKGCLFTYITANGGTSWICSGAVQV